MGWADAPKVEGNKWASAPAVEGQAIAPLSSAPTASQRAYMEDRLRGEMPAPVPMDLQRVAEQKATDATMLRGVADSAARAAQPSLGADLLISAGSGVSRGVTGLLDLPKTVAGIGKSFGANAAERLGGEAVRKGFEVGFSASPSGLIAKLPSVTESVDKATGGYLSYEPSTTAGDYVQTAGEFLPAGASGGIVRGVLAPAIMSETAGQLTEGTAAEPYARVAGALAGPAMASGLERLGRNVISPNAGADAARLRMAKQLEDAGIPITAGQRVGNEALRRQEALTGAGQRIAGTQNEALTRAALKTVGVTADRATPDVLNRAARSIGKVFDDVTDGVDITPDAAAVTRLNNAVETYTQLSAGGTAPVISNVFRETQKAFRANNTIPASTLKVWRSRLSSLTTSKDTETRAAAIEALSTVDDMIAGALRAAGRESDLARLATARQQYRNFLAVQKAASAASAGDGVLTAAQLRNAVASQGRAAYAQGRRGELADLARAGRVVLEPLPNSGTAQNLMAMGLPQTASGGVGATIAGIVSGGNPLAIAGGGALGTMMPPAIRAAKMTPLGQRYLSNQLAAPYTAPTNAPYSRAFLNALAQNGGN